MRSLCLGTFWLVSVLGAVAADAAVPAPFPEPPQSPAVVELPAIPLTMAELN
jgi:hypothetical protein